MAQRDGYFVFCWSSSSFMHSINSLELFPFFASVRIKLNVKSLWCHSLQIDQLNQNPDSKISRPPIFSSKVWILIFSHIAECIIEIIACVIEKEILQFLIGIVLTIWTGPIYLSQLEALCLDNFAKKFVNHCCSSFSSKIEKKNYHIIEDRHFSSWKTILTLKSLENKIFIVEDPNILWFQ